MAATYIYAVVPSDRAITVKANSIDGKPGAVRTVAADNGLAVVVSATDLRDLRGLSKEDTVRLLLAHQQVVEAVMQTSPVLPVKFGTVFPDESAARRLLAQGRDLLGEALEKYSALVQMEVVVLWDLEQVFAQIAQEEAIARVRAEMASKGSEESFTERVRVGQMVASSLATRRGDLRRRVTAALDELAVDLVQNPPMDDGTVANIGLLVNRDSRVALDERLELLDEEFGRRLVFRCIGPLPPYTFATVELRRPSFEEIDEARGRLGLGQAASPDEIRVAYRRRASKIHPDLNPDDADAPSQMTELNNAYSLLGRYAKSRVTNGERCPLTREAVESSVLIEIVRQEPLSAE